MKKIIGKTHLLFGLFVIMLIGGCYSELRDLEIGNLKWSPELGVPVVDSEFTLQDLLEANSGEYEYTTDENNTLVISLKEDSLFSQPASEYYRLSDQNITAPSISLTAAEVNLFNSNGQVTVNRQLNIDYPIQEGLTEIIIEQGNIDLQVEENFPATVDLSLEVMDPFASNLLNYQNVFDHFASSDLVSTDQSPSTFNNARFVVGPDPSLSQISLSIDLVLTRVNQDLVFSENSIDLIFDFNDQDFEALYGDLGPREMGIDETTIRTNTNIFDQGGAFSDLEYEFFDPRIKLILTNSMGLPFRLQVGDFTIYRNGNVDQEPVTTVIDVDAAPEGGTVSAEQDLDSDFKNILNSVPDSVSLSVTGAFDPDDLIDNFVLKNSFLQIGYEVEVPLEFSLSGLEINEAIPLDGIDPGGLQYALFKFTSENSLPLDLNFKADFLDADSTVLYTLFDGAFLSGGTSDQPESLENVIRLEDSSSDLSFLENVDRIGISATVSTTNNGSEMVRISSDAAVKFNLAVQTKYDVNINLN